MYPFDHSGEGEGMALDDAAVPPGPSSLAGGGGGSSSRSSSTTILNPSAASLQRLDDKRATGMGIGEVSNVRWLTTVEALQCLDQTSSLPLQSAPPSSPPKSGTMLLYDKASCPNYGDDGIEWVADPKWKSIDRVLRREIGEGSQSGSGSGSDSASGAMDDGDGDGGPTAAKGSSSGSSSALAEGASATYCTARLRPTFHRREYHLRGGRVLLHYLDSVRALRATNELVDRLVKLSANGDDAGDLLPVAGMSSGAGHASASSKKFSHEKKPPPAPSGEAPEVDVDVRRSPSDDSRHRRQGTGNNLGDTMNVLMAMVEEQDAAGTSSAQAAASGMGRDMMKAVRAAALNAVTKHVAPQEALDVVDAMEAVMEDKNCGDGDVIGLGDGSELDDFGEIGEVTELDIDEAIDQVLCGGGDGEAAADGDGSQGQGSSQVSQSGSSGSRSSGKNKAETMEDQILDSMNEILPYDLRAKLIGTTERMLDAAGVNITKAGSKGSAAALPVRSPPPIAGSVPFVRSPSAPPGEEGGQFALPEITDVTPDFHVIGHTPPTLARRGRAPKVHVPHMVITTSTPIPKLPPYVDERNAWQMFAAFVDFQQVAEDPAVRNISFNSMMPLSPYSFKVKMPEDIVTFSIRHIVMVGILLPKDHRMKRNYVGLELALKLTVQTEWYAAADLSGGGENAASVKGVKRPVFMAPCGGARLQLLSQISRTNFTIHPPATTQQTAINPNTAANFAQRVARTATVKDDRGGDIEKLMESKRKRENYLEEWMAVPGINATMTSDEVDRHRKVRFVERISNFITDNKGENALIQNDLTVGRGDAPTTLDGVRVKDLDEEEIDSLLGRVLMRYINICIDRCATQEELLGEINWNGYAGLSLLHHASLYNFMALITLLLNHGADTNILSAEGDLTPLHFAAAAGHRDVVEALIRSGCNPVPVDVNGDTPADVARSSGHTEVAALLEAYEVQSGMSRERKREIVSSKMEASGDKPSWRTSDVLLQSAFRELSLNDKLRLNLFADRSTAAPVAIVRGESNMMTSDSGVDELLGDSAAGTFSFISEEDKMKLREAMSLASEMDIKEMNQKAEHQDVRQYLQQSNYEAISAASQAMEKAKRKEAGILQNVSGTSDDPSKMQLSRALAMLVLRKNLPSS